MAVVVLYVIICSCLGLADGRRVIRFPTVRCTPPRGDDCVEIRKCPYFDDLLNRNPIPRSRGVIDEIRAHHCDFQGNRPYVCCNRTTTFSPSIFEATDIRRDFFSESGGFSESDGVSESLVNHRNYDLLPQNVCGPTSMTDFRITNGEVTDLSEFPWMALLAYETDGGGQGVVFKCAGTLISERFVLTAAHCTSDSTMVGVRLGEYDLDTKEDCDPKSGYCAPPTQDFFIDSIIIHPHYDQRGLLNDIALIKLIGAANFSYANVQPICLPMQDIDLSDKISIVSGWGVTEKDIRSPVLRKAVIPVVELSVCQRIYRKFANLTDKQVCAGGFSGINSCAGDSGGPLKYVGLVKGTPRFVQHAIVSYGPKQCGTEGKPDIYTKIYSFMNWILDQLAK